MNENIDLTKILKDCPEGWKFWSKVHGEVTFCSINTEGLGASYPIETKDYSSWLRIFTKDGKQSEQYQGECILVPSKDQQDWSKFSASWYKKEKFDPKILNPFDKVLVKHDNIWKVDFFSHISQYEPNGWCQCIEDIYWFCIPYNDDTKNLVGTKNEAPEFYHYWED